MTRKLIASICYLLAVCIFYMLVILPYIRGMWNLPLVPDLTHSLLPHVAWAGYVSDGLVYFLLFSLILEIRGDKNRWAYVIFLYSTLILTRSICVCLNPLMPPLGISTSLSYATHVSEPGMFFSGHVALSFIVFLLSQSYRQFKLCITTLVAFGLLLSRAHYSIDIVGGFSIAWCVHSACRHWAREWFVAECLSLPNDL